MTAAELSGYVLVFDQEQQMNGGPGVDGTEPGWVEKVAREAVVLLGTDDKPLALLLGDEPVATTEDGTLRITVDERGVKVEATLNLGFTFRVTDQDWSGRGAPDSRYMTHRTIKGLRIMELHLTGPKGREDAAAAVTP
jgi:phage head maturation protease